MEYKCGYCRSRLCLAALEEDKDTSANAAVSSPGREGSEERNKFNSLPVLTCGIVLRAAGTKSTVRLTPERRGENREMSPIFKPQLLTLAVISSILQRVSICLSNLARERNNRLVPYTS